MELGVPKSTLSNWLRDVPLSDEHRERLAARSSDGNRSRAAAIRASRIRRTEVLQVEAAAKIGPLTDREIFLLGVVAYWCEGSKEKAWGRGTQTNFINSDPRLVALFLRALDVIGVDRGDLVFRVSIHESADVATATSFWRAQVGGDDAQWRRPTLKRHRPATLRRNVGPAYTGCLAISVRRSVGLTRRLAGWARGIGEAIDGPSIASKQRSGVV
ncbi:MAG TPA: hypothetical protein VM933_05620, partial [Acidimicrobiales bacterium]|nr:hypothetical protein [Acidimicrobiales bacterium]